MSADIDYKSEDFIILKIIKEGKFGFIAKVKSKINSQIYAMKMIDLSSPGMMGEKPSQEEQILGIYLDNKKKINLKKYYENEFKLIKEMNHENVYKCLSSFKEGDKIYIITEYMDNGNLLDLLYWHKENDIKIEEKKLLKIFFQCIKGLYYLHKNGIMHRSIKLNNIVMDSNDRIKIINLKYATKEKTSKTKIKVGLFTAPEILDGKEYDNKVDIYSLGVIFSSLACFRSKLPRDKNDFKYSDELFNIINNMKEEHPDKRDSIEKIYHKFKSIYNDAMDGCLKCFIHFFKDEELYNDLITLEPLLNDNFPCTKLIMYLAKIYKNNEPEEFQKEFNKASYQFEKKFYGEGFEINGLSPQNCTKIIFSILNKELYQNQKQNNTTESNKDSKTAEEKFNDFYEKNGNFFIDHFFVKFRTFYKCENCIEDYITYSYKGQTFLNLDQEKVEKEPQNIFKVDDKTIEISRKCKKCTDALKQISTKFNDLSNNLIIFFGSGYNTKKLENQLELGKEEIECFDEKEVYELISIITMNNDNGNYIYWNREIEQKKFKKNEGEKKSDGTYVYYEIKEIIKDRKIIGLYYKSKTNNRKKINNNNHVNKVINKSDNNEVKIDNFINNNKSNNCNNNGMNNDFNDNKDFNIINNMNKDNNSNQNNLNNVSGNVNNQNDEIEINDIDDNNKLTHSNVLSGYAMI